ncbi:MAG: hypothetical protein U9R08_05260 [Nanoarchaeota archaeon]|nr:hypothetical protein [Nanoarchaeota archaeon]
MRKILIFSFILLFLCSFVSALDVDYDFNVVGNKLVVERSLIFDEAVTGNYSFSIPKDASSVSVYVDNELVDVLDTVVLDNNNLVKISYVTKEFLDENNFVFDFDADYNIDNLKIVLVLPEGASLKTPIKMRRSSSIFPDADVVTSDGVSIVLEWDYEDVKKGDNHSFFVRFKKSANYNLVLIMLLLVLVVFLVVKFIVFGKKVPLIKTEESKQQIQQVQQLPEGVPVVPVTGFEGHLKTAEEQVVNLLKLKEGACEQGTLRVATGFSKATLSRLLKELEDRKVIYKEKRGKKNLVFLRKH